MNKKTTIIIASNNAGKIKELQQMLGDLYEVKGMREAGFNLNPEENAPDFKGNALIKAEALAQLTDSIVVADDSGLCCEALNGAPGVITARYAGENATNEENVKKLLLDLKGIKNRKAHFVCSIALIRNNLPYIFEGKVDGEITESVCGEGGFGYDPVFKPIGWDKTFAESTSAEKNAISHRANAVKKMVQFLLAE